MNLFVWNPNRDSIYTCIERAPVDDKKNSIELYSGKDLPEDTKLTLVKTKKGIVPDFLYALSLQMYVSEKAKDVIRTFNIKGVRIFSAALQDRKGSFLQQFYWLNLCFIVSLLDQNRSIYKKSVTGKLFERIDRFIISEEKIPNQDLFLCDEISAPIFSERLCDAIQESHLTGAVFTPLQGYRWPSYR